MLESILQKDTELLIYLNNLGNKQWDPFWLFITDKDNWIPLFVVVLVLIYIKLGLKKTLFTLLFLTILVAFSDQFTNLVKYLTARIRPCNVPELQEYLRQFKYRPKGFGFWSGHAHTSTSFTVFIILLLRNKFKFIYLLFFFPLLFGLSRIYLRVHYPLDVTAGYIVGATTGFIFYKLLRLLYKKVFKEELL